MTEATNNPFKFLARLPDATLTQPFEKHTGIFVTAGLVEGKGRNVFIECIHGDKVPVVTYTLNVGGRGALVFGEQEFRDILSSGLALFEARQPGFYQDGPTPMSSAADLPVISSDVTGQ